MSESRSIAQSTLNEHERKVWDEWDKQNSSEVSDHMEEATKASTTYTVETLQRRENAHQKLLQYAEEAQSTCQTDTDTVESNANTEAATTPRTSKELSFKSLGDSPETMTQDPVATPTSNSRSLSQRRILEKFSSTLKHQGMEVLKLNRDKKWQTRFLTVSKEVIWLDTLQNDELTGDRGQCPIGFLWTKRFNPAKEYSISAIDRQGHGGVLFDQLVKVSPSGRSDLGHPLSKKQNDKFKDSVAVALEYSVNGAEKSVIIRCRSTDEAHFLCTGLRVIMDVFLKQSTAPGEPQSPV